MVPNDMSPRIDCYEMWHVVHAHTLTTAVAPRPLFHKLG
jgi:hypothetical protein